MQLALSVFVVTCMIVINSHISPFCHIVRSLVFKILIVVK